MKKSIILSIILLAFSVIKAQEKFQPDSNNNIAQIKAWKQKMSTDSINIARFKGKDSYSVYSRSNAKKRRAEDSTQRLLWLNDLKAKRKK